MTLVPLDDSNASRTPLLSCDGLTVRYAAAQDSGDAQRAALEDVTLAVFPGEILGLVGRNGAGKSTLIRAAAGLLAPSAGTVRVVGRDPGVDAPEIMRHAGFLLSDPALFAYLSAAETLAVVADQHGLRGNLSAQRVTEMLAMVELEDVRDQRAGDYSTGTAKRLALACAMLPAPSLLVLDEPFDVRRLTRALAAQREEGVGVLLSSHLLSTVADLCDRVVLIDRGRVLSQGTVPELIASHAPANEQTLDGAYAALVGEA
jgi:ABC-type multidrug transport system ATPase subunit